MKKITSEYLFEESKDWIISFVIAAVAYFIILPAILGTSSPMVVVSSCSEKPYINIGDILIIQGLSIEDVNSPTAVVEEFTDFEYEFEGDKVSRIFVDNTPFTLDTSNDVVVYSAIPSRVQVIHRAFVKVLEESTGKYYLITMGDANPIPDQVSRTGSVCIKQNTGCISAAITQQNLVGKRILFNVPLLGHVKLFFCDITGFCAGHSNLGTNYKYKLSC
jgi:signal peptidase I